LPHWPPPARLPSPGHGCPCLRRGVDFDAEGAAKLWGLARAVDAHRLLSERDKHHESKHVDPSKGMVERSRHEDDPDGQQETDRDNQSNRLGGVARRIVRWLREIGSVIHHPPSGRAVSVIVTTCVLMSGSDSV